jgi:hypothetical protein
MDQDENGHDSVTHRPDPIGLAVAGNNDNSGHGVGGDEVAQASRHKSQEHPCDEVRDEPIEHVISNVSIVVTKFEPEFRFSTSVMETDSLVV